MELPFEGLLGDTLELRLIQFMLPSKGLEFNISELAQAIHANRRTTARIVKKLAKWNVLQLSRRRGNTNYYTINEETGFAEALEYLNYCIIKQMRRSR